MKFIYFNSIIQQIKSKSQLIATYINIKIKYTQLSKINLQYLVFSKISFLNFSMHHNSSLPVLPRSTYIYSADEYQQKISRKNNQNKYSKKMLPNQPSIMKELLVDDSQINKKSQNILDNFVWKNKIQFNPSLKHFKKQQNFPQTNKKDNIKDLLQQQYKDYQSEILYKRNPDHIYTQDTQIAVNIQSGMNRNNSDKNGNKFYGKRNNSQIDNKFQKQAHEDLQYRQMKSQQLKQMKKVEDYIYSKQLQNKILKTLEKGKTFRKYFNNVNLYQDSNQEQFKSNTEPIVNKKIIQKNEFVQKRINQDHYENMQKSYQRMEKSRQQKMLLIQDLKKQMQYKQKMKNIQKMARLNYNNQLVLKDIRQLKSNPQSIEVNNPQITNIFHRRYAKNINK